MSVVRKISTDSNVNSKTYKNNTMYSVQELHLCLFSFSAEVILASFTLKNTCSLLITLTIYGLSLHFRLFIEIHFNEFTLGRLQPKNMINEINIQIANPNILLYYVILFH